MVARVRSLGPELDWLPDDTEEALLGTSTHQAVIVVLNICLALYARAAGLPWFVGNQLQLRIPRGAGRPAYHPSPDLLVHPTLGDIALASLPLVQYGPPALALEIASPGTAREHDLNTLAPGAKPSAYAQAGIAEYLVYDPTGLVLPDRVRAWHLGAAGGYEPWEPQADGRWHSALGVSFAPEVGGILLRVYDPAGNLISTPYEMAAQLAERDRAVAEREARIAALEAELRRIGGA